MKRQILLLLALALTAAPSTAGETFTVKSITSGQFSAKTIRGVVPLADGQRYSQLSADGTQVVAYSFRDGKPAGVLFDAKAAHGATLESIDGYIMAPDEKTMLVQTQTRYIYRRSFTAEFYIYDIANKKLARLSAGGPQQAPVFSPDGRQVAFVRDNNIFLVKLMYGNAESQVTTDGRRNAIINGIPDWVNEEEFSFNSAIVFSADSKMLCWTKYDETAVKEYSFPLFKGLKPERNDHAAYPGAYTYKYPVPGEVNARVSVWSYDIKSHQTRQLQVPLPDDGYIPRIKATTLPDQVAVFTMNRHQDEMNIYLANARSTVAQLLVSDKVDKYIQENVLAQTIITPQHLILTSERDGFNHIYLYKLSGQLERSITSVGKQRNHYLPGDAPLVVTDVYGLDEASGDLFFAAKAEGPTETKVYVSHKNGKTDCLTPRDGTNIAVFSTSFKYFINVWSDIDTPPVTTLCQNNGKLLTTLIDNKELADKLAAYDLPTKEFFTFTTTENVTLVGYMLKPKNFDATKRYPVVMYQYGGPGAQEVLNTWNIGAMRSGGIYEEFLAQQGFIVVCVDNRGTGGRGAAFEKCTYLRLGELEARDQVETALWLGQQPYVDKDRIAIWGWSYGGWNTLMSMSEGREVFRAGVAVAPPTCWRYYDSIYTERYMRTPNENPSGYDEVNPIARASKLHGDLLLCHGMADDNVHFRNSVEYTEALVQADKDFKENFYTNRNHSIFGGNTRNHLFRQITNHFINTLHP